MLTYMEAKNFNLWVPSAVNRLLDKSRKKGRGEIAPTVCAAIYTWFNKLTAEQREEYSEEYGDWLASSGAAAEDFQAAVEASEKARKEKPGRNRSAG